MDPMSFGSASPAMGGGDALNEAVARRSTGQAGASQQVTPSAATFNPQTQPPMGAPTSSPAQAAAPSGPAQPFESGEAKAIISALSTRLRALSKMAGV